MRVLICVALALSIGSQAEAGNKRRSKRGTAFVAASASVRTTQTVVQPAAGPAAKAVTTTTTKTATVAVVTASVSGSDDALNEVNEARARRGLRPYLNDPLLNAAARACARVRAASRIHGHLPSDFAYLPAGAFAAAAGCGALTPDWGWGACATFDNFTYCGAAWIMGSDGRRYMHQFLR